MLKSVREDLGGTTEWHRLQNVVLLVLLVL